MESRQSQNGEREKKQQHWVAYKNGGTVFVNQGLFEKGLVAIKPASQQQLADFVCDSKFRIKNREFSFCTSDQASTVANPNAINKANKLLSKLIEFYDPLSLILSEVPENPPKIPESFKPNSFIFRREQIVDEVATAELQKDVYDKSQNKWIKSPHYGKTKYKYIWHSYTSDEEGKLYPLDVTKFSGLEAVLNNLPKNKAPEKFTSQEIAPLLKTMRSQQNLIIYERLLSKEELKKQEELPKELQLLQHRDEIFLPLDGMFVFPWQSKNDESFIFRGFKEFVTAQCLFGASLRGLDQRHVSHALMKHDISFEGAEKIEYIEFDFDKANPYEDMLFKEFEKQVDLMKKFSSTQPPVVRYHLPYLDYVLFGVELFISGRITLNALGELFSTIFKKKHQYVERIQKICADKGVKIIMESPFANLFGTIESTIDKIEDLYSQHSDDSKEKVQAILEDLKISTKDLKISTDGVKLDSYTLSKVIGAIILKTLNVSIDEVDPSKIDSVKRAADEKSMLMHCLDKLQNNTYNEEYATVWHDFISRLGEDQINSIEDLFKLANAVVHGVAAYDKEDFEVCSVLPLSEKQIQVSYDIYSNYPSSRIHKSEGEIANLKRKLEELNKNYKDMSDYFSPKYGRPSQTILDKIQEILREEDRTKARIQEIESELEKLHALKADITKHAHKYPAMFNLAILDNFLTYGHKNNGLAFYSDFNNETVSALIKTGILETAHENTAKLSSSRHGLFTRKKSTESVKTLQDFLYPKSITIKNT